MKRKLKLKAAMLSLMMAGIMLPMTTNAQKSDGFFNNNDFDNISRNREEGVTIGGMQNENPTPLGSGLVIMLAAGVGYVVLKNKED